MEKATYQGIYPIGNSNPLDMPVADVDRAAQWYERCMAFSTVSRDPSTKSATIRRDSVEIRLAENGRDPNQESCYIEVTDVEGARAELVANFVNVSEIRIDNYGGNKYRVFFAKDDDGLCYCLGTKLTE